MSRNATLVFLALLFVSLPGSAATRLTYHMADKQVGVRWPDASFPIRYEVDRRLANALPGGTIDRAFGMWSAIEEATLTFEGSVVDGARAGYDGKNTISIADGLFANQGALAYTTNWYDSKGHLTESDVVIDASLSSGKYNVQAAIAHEIGHMLGLDHSAVLSSVMFPYLPRGADLPELDSDDRIGITGVYPKIDPALERGTLRGRVVNGKGGIFAAQVVAMNELGVPVATTLSQATGAFELGGLPPGNYRVYAEPLDGPVETRNLAGIYRDAKEDFFPTQFLDHRVRLDSGQVVGNLIVNSSDRPVVLNPKWIGIGDEMTSQFTLTSTASLVRNGQTINLAIAGDGIIGGMTKFEVMNPGVTRVSEFNYASNYVYATFRVAGDAAPGSAVVLVTSGNDTAALTGALRILTGNGGRTRIARR
ncbi:MAG TPA: matrixin family metalloprotease [Thermoanaerobaculia bacterium]|nr:matrixin family metalloprotease [Thermoanaerobaculia bacterium]